MNKTGIKPFSCTYSPNLAQLLWKLKCTLAISTYQAGKVIFICPAAENRLTQLPRNFRKPMGIAVSGRKMAIATKSKVMVFANANKIANRYPAKTNTYDALYLPRATYYCGNLDVHDLWWGKEHLYAINTRFSCLSVVTDNFNFEPIWKPNFITELRPTDRCHLNGLTMIDGEPTYVSALGKSNEKEGWRATKLTGGIVVNIKTNEIVADGLPMPHSPRYYDDKLYILLSATGQLACIDTENNSYEVVTQLNGFARGMTKYDKYLFIGLSKVRKKNKPFSDMPIAPKALNAGVVVVDMETKKVVGQISYLSSVEEIYDVQVLPNIMRPNIVHPENDIHELAIDTPFAKFWRKPMKK